VRAERFLGGDILVDVGRLAVAAAAATAEARPLLGEDVLDLGVVAAGDGVGGGRRPVGGAASKGLTGGSASAGSGAPPASPASSRSSSGLRSNSASTKASSSRWLSCSRRIDCMSWGVSARLCDCRNSSRGVSAMPDFPR